MPTKTTTKKAAAPAAAKPAAKQPAAKKAAAPAKKAAKSFSQDDVALRAYFLGEKRQKLGLPGNPHSDWVEAERQLTLEARPKTRLKKA